MEKSPGQRRGPGEGGARSFPGRGKLIKGVVRVERRCQGNSPKGTSCRLGESGSAGEADTGWRRARGDGGHKHKLTTRGNLLPCGLACA